MISNDPVLASSARILDASYAIIGTGFVVSIFRDNTHALVLASTSSIERSATQSIHLLQKNVYVTFHADTEQRIWEASVPDWLASEGENVCALVIKGEGKLPARLRTLPLSLASNLEGRKVSIFGYPDVHSTLFEGAWRYCEICRPGPRHQITNDLFLQLETQDMPDGYKGSPIWDDVHRHVLGMITHIERHSESGTHKEAVYATPVDILHKIYQRVLKKHISEISMQFERPSPFRYNEPYVEGEAHTFFGYEDVTERIKQLLDTHPKILAVLGPEKSGKTSVIQAGLIPRLRNGEIKDHPHPGICKVHLTSQEPLRDMQLQGLHNATLGIQDAVHRLCQTYGYTGMFVILDQFEDFLHTCPLDIQVSFIDQLLELADKQVATVIIVLRDEFYSLLAKHEKLMPFVERALINVFAPRESEQLFAIIKKNAEQEGIVQDPQQLSQLIDHVLKNIEREKGKQNSPLARLNHYLSLEEQYRRTNQVTKGETQVVPISLDDWAEALFQRLDEQQQRFLKRIVLQVIEPGNEALGLSSKKRHVPVEDLCTSETENDLVEELIDQHFLVTNRDRQNGFETVTLAQDELIHEWLRLREWFDEKRQFLLWQEHFQQQLQGWMSSHVDIALRSNDLLLPDPELILSETWLKAWPEAFDRHARLFVETSRRKQEHNTYVLREAYETVERQLAETEQRHHKILARYLIDQARQLYQQTHYRQQGVQLAAAALSLFPSPEADNALREALVWLPRKIVSVTTRHPIQTVEFSGAGRYAVAYKDATKIGEPQGEIGDLKGVFGDLKRLKWHFGLYQNTDIRCMAMSPDGAYLAVSEANGETYFCFLEAQEKPYRDLLEKEVCVSGLLFSPKGRYLAIIYWDDHQSVIRIKECVSLSTTIEVPPYQFRVTALGFNVSESILAVGYEDGLVNMWYLGRGGEVHMRYSQNYGKRVNALALSRTASFLAIALESKEVKVLNTGTKESLRSYKHKDQIRSILFSPDDRYIVSGSDDTTARIYDVARESELRLLEHDQGVHTAEFSSDSAYLVTASRNNMITIWDVRQSFEQWMQFTLNESIHKVAFSMEKRYLFSAGNYCDICVWDIAKSAHCTVLPRKLSTRAKSSVHTLLWSSNTANYALIVGSEEKPVEIWNFREGYELYSQPNFYKKAVRRILYSPDKKYLATIGYDRTLYLWHSLVDEQPRRIRYPGTLHCIAWSSDGSFLATGSKEATACLWQIPSGQKHMDFPHASSVSAIAFSNDSHMLITGSENGEVHIWNREEDHRHLCTPNHAGKVNIIAVSSHGNYLATVGDDGSLFLRELKGNQLYNFPVKGRINAIQFAPGGQYLIAAYAGGRVYVWRTVDGSQHQALLHPDEINNIAVSSDGKYIVTGSNDGTVGIWAFDTNQQIAFLKHTSRVTALAFSSDDKYLATGCDDGTVKIWLWHPEQLIREAMSRVTHILTKEEWSRYAGNEPYEIIASLPR